MRLVDSARQQLQQYYLQLMDRLEQAVREYCLAHNESERTDARQRIKDHTRQLVLLEPFYRNEVNPREAEKISRLCALLTRENADASEHQELLTGFYRSMDRLA
ncbi:MAG: hypothetical protein CMP91_09490 [Gammaproteobacteria bacterium]|nr:hypothetical protein [Gammaproteobacteria bacterium]|tara:strand:+ start:45858 stop:46169 length:312 start_codon:yes stop_codon:yes gene_type:complete